MAKINDLNDSDVACYNCKAFFVIDEVMEQGECRRRAPIPFKNEYNEEKYFYGQWPEISMHSWCCEFIGE